MRKLFIAPALSILLGLAALAGCDNIEYEDGRGDGSQQPQQQPAPGYGGGE